MQTGGTNCISPDNDKITFINITVDSFISVNNSKLKQNYDQNKKNRGAKQGKLTTQKMQIKNFLI